MNKLQTSVQNVAKIDRWKTAKNLALAVAPTVITVAACALIIKKLDKN